MKKALEFLVREGLPSDLAEIQNLFRELDDIHADLLPEYFQCASSSDRPKEVIEKKLDNLQNGVFVALSNNQLVGFLDLQILASPPYPIFKERKVVFINYLYVRKKMRRHGVARLLFMRAKNWATERGVDILQLSVYCVNEEAINFYQSQGMKQVKAILEVKFQ